MSSLSAPWIIHFVCAQHGQSIEDIEYSRECKSLTGELVKPVSKSQGGLLRGMHWRKRDYKLRYWRTGTVY